MEADRFCAGCGAKVPAAVDAELRPGAFLPQDAPPSWNDPNLAAVMHSDRLRRARRWLMAVGVLTVLGGVVVYSTTSARAEAAARAALITNVLLGGFYVGMWAWAKKNLVGATATALTVFVAVNVINVAVEPSSLMRGMIMKILFFAALVSCLREALAARSERALP